MTARVALEVVAGGDHSLGVRGRPPDDLYAWLATRIAGWLQSV